MSKSKEIVEFGDFQTPIELAREVAFIASASTEEIATIIEPTCGTGTFLKAFSQTDTASNKLVGWEINPSYVEIAKSEVCARGNVEISVLEQDFFHINWETINYKYKEPILFAGNPPWVTSSELGRVLSENVPKKSNFQGHSGLEAITGKSNFDISEWMLIKIAKHISGSDSAMAFLVKTSVARKIFMHIANHKLPIEKMYIREIDAKKYFGVNVDACLFYAKGTRKIPKDYQCPVYSDLGTSNQYKVMGLSNNHLVSNLDTYGDLSDIDTGCEFKWRSGVKHDASKIMEFKEMDEGFINGLGENVHLPWDFLYPMYKSSNISKETLKAPEKWMLVTQKKIGDETKNIKILSPKTWEYLINHSDMLDSRKSSIYKNAPRFSIFGVGEYTFKPWKVVISGLYKNLSFTTIGFYREKPIVLDDTCYILSFDTQEEAVFVLNLLKSDISKQFISSLVFKDSKRPITVALLNRINLRSIALRLNLEDVFDKYFFKEELQLSLLS